MSISVDEARELMHEWVESASLRTHMECVAACMSWYAARVQPDRQDDWVVAGLLHDMDYEKHPTIEEHPFVCVEHLKTRGDVPEEVVRAILSHADYSGAPRDTDMARHLFAVDELAGFITACSRVRPDGIVELETKSVRKKLKNLKFAAAVSRDDVAKGAEEIKLELVDHITNCIDALRGQRERLGI